MSESPKRIGLIGLSKNFSWAGRGHIHYLKDTPLYKITALQNSSKAAAEAAAEHHGLPGVATYDNPKDLAKDPNVDIVAVSVNVPRHYELIKPTLEAGKDIFVEWPLARNLEEAEEIVALAKEKGVKATVGLQARQSPTILRAKEIVESGKLGKILGTTLFGHAGVFGPVLPEMFLYATPLEAGANLVTIAFAHAFDALCFVLGEVESLSAVASNHRPEVLLVDNATYQPIRPVKKTAHDYVSFTGKLVNGGNVDATYVGGLSQTGRDFYWEIIGTDGTLVIEGTEQNLAAGIIPGLIQMYQPTIKFVSAEMGAKLETVEVEKAGDWDKGNFSYNVGKAWDAQAGVGLDKGHTVTTFEDALVRHRMVEAIYRSSRNGTVERYL